MDWSNIYTVPQLVHRHGPICMWHGKPMSVVGKCVLINLYIKRKKLKLP